VVCHIYRVDLGISVQGPVTKDFVIEFLPAFSAALAIPDLAALIFSAYCNGTRGDFSRLPAPPV